MLLPGAGAGYPHEDLECGSPPGRSDVRHRRRRYSEIRFPGTAADCGLILKLSEIELVKQVIHDTPVLLLDDVLSELDHNRQNYLLNSIHDIQTMITCTGLDEFVNHRFSINKVFRVIEGAVYSEN